MLPTRVGAKSSPLISRYATRVLYHRNRRRIDVHAYTEHILAGDTTAVVMRSRRRGMDGDHCEIHQRNPDRGPRHRQPRGREVRATSKRHPAQRG